MATVEDALSTQVRNIEQQYGKTIGEWTQIVRSSGKAKHGEIVALLKSEYGMSHGNANRVALIAREADASSIATKASQSGLDPIRSLYDGPKAGLLPIHDRLVEIVDGLGGDVELAPKSGYVSVRRKKQFAMIQPSTASRVDLGLILKDVAPEGRLEPSGSFNAMFTHRVRLASPGDVDAAVAGWLRDAYERAG